MPQWAKHPTPSSCAIRILSRLGTRNRRTITGPALDAIAARYTQDCENQEVGSSLPHSVPPRAAAEIERWNRILTAPNPTFNTAPHAFLVQMTRTLKPGRALDAGMGQGRNTIYLAQHGWERGFDPADRAVAAAKDQAEKLGVKITAHIDTMDSFDWGQNQWDLIVLSYVGARGLAGEVSRSLRPDGMVVVEGFHRDATKTASIGGGVVFDTNELPQLFPGLRVVRYEDAIDKADFGGNETRVVRLAAVKP
jgi:SAM-dependent methyltransferase